MKPFKDLQTPKYLCEKYEKETTLFNWTPSKIGKFMASSLLIGKTKTSKKPAIIREKSFDQLIMYVKELNKTAYKNCAGELFTPTELYELNPYVWKLEWNPAKIGMFFKCHLLIGVNRGIGKSVLITRNSYELLIDYANEILAYKKVRK